MLRTGSETSKALTKCKFSSQDEFEQSHSNTYHSVITATGSLSGNALNRPIGLLVMGLRVSLHEGDKVLWDLPLEETDWEDVQKESLRRELGDLEKDLDALCGICDFYSNKKRLQMVSHIIGECGNKASFTDLLRVAVNPKYVNDLVNKASTNHLVIKDDNGYRVSPKGLGSFLLLSLATRKLLQELDSANNRNKSFEEE